MSVTSFGYNALNSGIVSTTIPLPGALPWMTSNDMARIGRYRQYLLFDAGKHDVGRLPIGSAALVANYAATFVRKGASYLMPEPVTYSVVPPDSSAAAQAVAVRCEHALMRVGEDNDLDLADLETAMDASVLGDAAYKVTWDAARRCVRVVPVDVQSLYVTTANDDPRAVTTVRQFHGVLPSTSTGQDAHFGAVSGTILEEWSGERYRRVENEIVIWDGPNPYGAIPFVIFPNSPKPLDFWGESDLVNLIGLNQQLDRRLSVLASLLELEGNPVTILENVNGSAGIEVAPGAVWELPENAHAETLQVFSGDSAAVHLQTIEAIYKALHDVAEMPRSAFGDASGVTSGTALEAILQPLLQRTKRKRMVWTTALRRRARLILGLMHRYGTLDLGGYQPTDLRVTVNWPAIIPTDRHDIVADEIALHQAGLHSQQTAMDAIGVEDPAIEARAVEKEAGQDGTHAAVTEIFSAQ